MKDAININPVALYKLFFKIHRMSELLMKRPSKDQFLKAVKSAADDLGIPVYIKDNVLMVKEDLIIYLPKDSTLLEAYDEFDD